MLQTFHSLAFCALSALGLARQDGKVSNAYSETLFMVRWLFTAHKQKRFPKSIAAAITLMLERGHLYGVERTCAIILKLCGIGIVVPLLVAWTCCG
ncbi:DUF2913 family protein [Rahnella sp. PCH160]|uniref:DUF2913 family protein n=1 Tax=Rahnella sp. PCH160 TaxID=3447928 RepID=UPI0039FC7D23